MSRGDLWFLLVDKARSRFGLPGAAGFLAGQLLVYWQKPARRAHEPPLGFQVCILARALFAFLCLRGIGDASAYARTSYMMQRF